jgi:hypothetical protein
MLKMKKKWGGYATIIKGASILIVITAILSLAFSIGTTESRLIDAEQTPGDTYGAWTSVQWTQTTQSDFEGGILNNADTSSSPGSVTLGGTPDFTGWYNSSWNYRKKLMIDHTKVASNLTNFPVLISLTSDSDLVSSARADGYDILFTSGDGTTKLDHEIENFTISNGKLIAWVRTPSLSSSANTDLYLYFNNSAAANQQNGTGVWDANFMGVWHLKESGSGVAGEFKDSTSNANNGQGGSGPSGPPTRTSSGKIGDAQDYDGADYINVTNTPSLQPMSALSLSGWINPRTFGSVTDIDPIIRKGDSNPNNYQLAVDSGGGVPNIHLMLDENDNSGLEGVTTISANTWYYIAGTWDGTTRQVYLNGNQEISGSRNGTIGSDTRDLYIGGRIGLTDSINGILDEVRISNIARSASWITTEYNNTLSPSTFYTLGSRESPAIIYSSPGILASKVLDTTILNARWDAIEWDSSLAGGTGITFDMRASDTAFLTDNTTLSWISVGSTSPVYAGLPTGRYFQWRATLTTADTALTPTLYEVRAYYT